MQSKQYSIFFPPVIVGALILHLFQFLRSEKIFSDYIAAAWVTGIIIMTIGFIPAVLTRESFGKDLDFVER